MQGLSGVHATTSSIGTGLSLIVELKAITERLNQHLGSHFPKSLVAFSIGGVPLIDYLSQDKANYISTVLVSTPLNLEKFCMGDNPATDACVEDVHKALKDNSDVLTTWNVDLVSKAIKSATLAEYYAEIGSVIGSNSASIFHSVEPYSRLAQLTKPTLLIYALDDESIEFIKDVDIIQLCKNPNIAVCVTEDGGHCGFHTINRRCWLGSVILEYLSASMRPEF
jgi:predicted alpha/beta-fold hydrolase